MSNSVSKALKGTLGLAGAEADIDQLATPAYTRQMEVAAGTDEDMCVAVAQANISITAAYIVPDATTAANGTNYASIDVTVGDTAAGSTNSAVTAMTTASTALTARTKRSFTLSTTVADLEVDAGEAIYVEHDQSNGTGAAVNGLLVIEWEYRN